MIAGFPNACQAQVKPASKAFAAAQTTPAPQAIPDFKKCFDILVKNRITYNQYNDSIFIIHDHDKWVNFFRRRAQKNHQIYAANKEAINTIIGYFAQDESQIDHQAYHALYIAYRDNLHNEVSDPFLTQQIGQVMDRHFEHCDSASCQSKALMMNVWLGTSYSNFALLGNDTSYVRKSYQCFERVVKAEEEHRCTDKAALAYALRNTMASIYLVNKAELLADYYQHREALRQLMAQDTMKTVLSKTTYQSMIASLNMADETLLRNVYMTDPSVMDKHLADSLMQNIVARNLSNSKITPNTHIRTLLMQVKLGQITMNQALKASLKAYKTVRPKLLSHRLSKGEFTAYISPFDTFFYINDEATISFAKKRSIVRQMCRDIIQAYTLRNDTQANNSYVRYLNMLTTYPRIMKYLTPEQRIRFLNALTVSTQVTTYAHSAHVAMIAETLMQGILDKEPTLLIGTMGYKFAEDVMQDRKELLEYAHDAAMYHDLGKNSIISVVNNDYRPLTDEEFAIIKRHPELGLQYLEITPSLEKFHDTTLGHHKWYNGMGGYPEGFDNTQSKMRFMIDVITLSDCMQAATERVGRNYKGEKTFDTVMAEFRRDAGTRYNPKLVRFIDANPDVAKKLAELINEGWVDIYYDIYKMYF